MKPSPKSSRDLSRGFQHELRVERCHPQQDARGPARDSGAMLPVVQGSEADPKQFGKFALRQPKLPTSRHNAFFPGNLLRSLKKFRVQSTSLEPALAIGSHVPYPGRGGLTALDPLFCANHFLNFSRLHRTTYTPLEYSV